MCDTHGNLKLHMLVKNTRNGKIIKDFLISLTDNYNFWFRFDMQRARKSSLPSSQEKG